MDKVLFKFFWVDYEEDWYIIIFERDGILMRRSKGHNVISGDFDITEEISQEEALADMMENAEYEDDYD